MSQRTLALPAWWPTCLQPLAFCSLLALLVLGAARPAAADPIGLPPRAYLPVLPEPVPRALCPVASSAPFRAIPVLPPVTDRPAAQHADLNLALRSYSATTAPLGLVYLGPGDDPEAPQLAGLFASGGVPAFVSAHRVYDWDWSCNCRGPALTTWPVTLLGLRVAPGEPVRPAARRPAIYQDDQGPYIALVLYAEERRITLKYTREDNVVSGYTLHIENLCVDPNLLALYRAWNDRGRTSLPGLRSGQALGTAAGGEIQVAIRDCGTFMDPRSRNDWWIGLP